MDTYGGFGRLFEKERVNSDIFLSVAANTPIKVEVGGGFAQCRISNFISETE